MARRFPHRLLSSRRRLATQIQKRRYASHTLLLAAVSLLALLVAAGIRPTYAQGPVVFDVQTSLGNDSLILGAPGSIIFTMDASDYLVLEVHFPFEINFSGQNSIGMLNMPGNVVPSPAFVAAYDHTLFSTDGHDGVGIDSVLFFGLDHGGSSWVGAGEAWRINFAPSALGTIRFDSIFIPIRYDMAALDIESQPLPLEWLGDGRELTVYILTGDFAGSGDITSADILALVSYIFLGSDPASPCVCTGDVDCSGQVTSADIIYLVNYVFKSGSPPCDVNALIPGTWSCP